MKLNDFQYNWYLHFEEENEKSIIGLPFDPYFEAHKFDEESILGFVERAKRMRQLRTRWISVFTDAWNKFESFWEAFKKKTNGYEPESFYAVIYAVIMTFPIIAGLMGNWRHDHLSIMERIGLAIFNYFVMVNVMLCVGWICFIAFAAFLSFINASMTDRQIREMIWTIILLIFNFLTKRRVFAVIVTLLFCVTEIPQTEEITFENVHQFLSKPWSKRCATQSFADHNYELKKIGEVYLVKYHRDYSQDNPVLIDNTSVVLSMKNWYVECMQNFK